MNKALFASLFLAAASLILCLLQASPTTAQVSSLSNASRGIHDSSYPERHPELTQALTKLWQAQVRLKHSSNGYGGHKKKALAAVDLAITEVNSAIDFDDHGVEYALPVQKR